jgi:hypothetical protein
MRGPSVLDFDPDAQDAYDLLPQSDKTYARVKADVESRYFGLQARPGQPFRYLYLDEEGAYNTFTPGHAEAFLWGVYYFEQDRQGKWIRHKFHPRWTTDQDIRRVTGVSFDPTGLQKGIHNLFRGLEASLLPAVPDVEAEGLCARVHDHVLRVLGAGDATAAGALTDWLARIVQTPGVAAPMAPVLVGGRAALFVRWFRLRLVGARYSSDVVDGSPRSMDRLFVHVDSARSVEPTLAAFVGSPVVKCLQFLRAGSEVHEEPNHFSAVFTGPTADILQAVPDRSRFPVFVCCNALCGDVDYFTRLEHHLDKPRVQRAYYQSLMRRPL